MINLTDRPILLDQKFSDKNIRNAITAVLQELERRYGVEPPNVVWSHQQFAFQWYFRPLSLKAKAIFDDSFIQCIYDFAMATANKPIIQFNKNMCRYSLAKPAPAHATRYLRLGCKLLLVYLWSKRKLLLPTIFTPGPGFQPHIEDNELYGYVSCFERYKDEDKLKRQIFYYMPHVLWATDWNRVEDLTLGEFSQLHRAQITFRAGVTSHAFSPSPIPWTGFLQELTNDYPSRVSFGREELVTYSNWVTHRRVVTHSLAEFAELENVVVAKKKIKNQASSKQANKKKVAKKSPSSTHAEKIFGLAKEGSHDSALQYFKTYESTHRNGIDWLEREGFYKGREHIDIRLYSSVWIKVFKSYIHHRVEVKGFEAKKAVLSALNLLADYLFLYLPWWKEIYSNSMIEIPIRPRDFTRYPFISSSTDEPESVLPKTFGEILKLRRPSPATRREALLMIRRFFDYVALQYADNEDIAGHRFRNPISKEFDVPTSKKRTKTNKVPFEKNTYGYVLYYGYALEAFGQYLQELCFSRGLSQNRRELINARWFDAEEFGFVPFVRYRNNIIPVKEVPNVYSWTTRKFFQNNGQSVEFFVPHLTQLRLIVSGIEVGLRFMGLKWLDRRTWDKDNPKSPDLSQFAFVPIDLTGFFGPS